MELKQRSVFKMSGNDKRKARNWANVETSLLVDVLVDDEFNFTSCLERHALKRPANEEVFWEILKILL